MGGGVSYRYKGGVATSVLCLYQKKEKNKKKSAAELDCSLMLSLFWPGVPPQVYL